MKKVFAGIIGMVCLFACSSLDNSSTIDKITDVVSKKYNFSNVDVSDSDNQLLVQITEHKKRTRDLDAEDVYATIEPLLDKMPNMEEIIIRVQDADETNDYHFEVDEDKNEEVILSGF